MEKDFKNLGKLQRLLSLMDEDSLTKEQFTESFRIVVDQIKKLKEENLSEFNKIKETFEMFRDKIELDNSEKIGNLKNESISTIISSIENLKKNYAEKMAVIDKKVLEIKNGKDADEEIVVDKVLKSIKIPTIEEIKNDLPVMSEEVRDSLELLQGEERLSWKAIKGLRALIRKTLKDSSSKQVVGGLRPAGTGIEVLSGTINGINTAFTVNFVPEFITRNGQSIYSGYGYSLSSVAGALTITLENAPEVGDILRSHYKEL